MKKLILSLALVAAGAASYAQISQGSLMLGGSLGFNSNGGGKSETTIGGVTTSVDNKAAVNWNFSPAVGYFLSDALAVGLRLNVGGTNRGSATSTDGSTTENITSFDWGAELFGRYYMELGTNLYFFADAGVGFGMDKWTMKVADPTDPAKLADGAEMSNTDFGVNIAPGLAYFPSPTWGIDFTLNRLIGFNMNTNKGELAGNSTKTTSNEFGIGVGLMPTLGLHYYMGK